MAELLKQQARIRLASSSDDVSMFYGCEGKGIELMYVVSLAGQDQAVLHRFTRSDMRAGPGVLDKWAEVTYMRGKPGQRLGGAQLGPAGNSTHEDSPGVPALYPSPIDSDCLVNAYLCAAHPILPGIDMVAAFRIRFEGVPPHKDVAAFIMGNCYFPIKVASKPIHRQTLPSVGKYIVYVENMHCVFIDVDKNRYVDTHQGEILLDSVEAQRRLSSTPWPQGAIFYLLARRN